MCFFPLSRVEFFQKFLFVCKISEKYFMRTHRTELPNVQTTDELLTSFSCLLWFCWRHFTHMPHENLLQNKIVTVCRYVVVFLLLDNFFSFLNYVFMGFFLFFLLVDVLSAGHWYIHHFTEYRNIEISWCHQLARSLLNWLHYGTDWTELTASTRKQTKFLFPFAWQIS